MGRWEKLAFVQALIKWHHFRRDDFGMFEDSQCSIEFGEKEKKKKKLPVIIEFKNNRKEQTKDDRFIFLCRQLHTPPERGMGPS